MGLIYAIGDIHGRNDLLVKGLEWIDAQIDGQIITLGDYVDRGPDSKGVIQTLIDRPEIITLMGNHEAMMIESIGTPRLSDIKMWLDNGGDATLASYDADKHAAYEITRWLPSEHEDFLKGLLLTHITKRYAFVHAGFMPGVPITEQNPNVCLWIREQFLRHEFDFGKHVVHGHTPHPYDLTPFTDLRTNLDSGAVFTGKLTIGVFEDAFGGPPIDIKIIEA